MSGYQWFGICGSQCCLNLFPGKEDLLKFTTRWQHSLSISLAFTVCGGGGRGVSWRMHSCVLKECVSYGPTNYTWCREMVLCPPEWKHLSSWFCGSPYSWGWWGKGHIRQICGCGSFRGQWTYVSPFKGGDDQGEAWVVEAGSASLPASSPFPSPWDYPIRGKAFAVPIPLGIAVTWAIWLMVCCERTLRLLLSGIRNRNSPIHSPNCFLTFTAFYSPPLEHLSQVVPENWRLVWRFKAGVFS